MSSKYWTDKVDGQDTISAGDFNDAFNAIAEDMENNNSDNDIIEIYENLLDPRTIGDNSFGIRLKSNTKYCINQGLSPFTFINGEIVYISTSPVDGGRSFTVPEGASDIIFSYGYIDKEHTMIIEGETLPPYFKPYGVNKYVADEYLQSVYSEIGKYHPKTIMLDEQSSRHNLIPNAFYTLETSITTEFFITGVPKDFDQIVIHATIQDGGTVISWGTTWFYNGETPDIEVGEYEFIFTFINGKWVVGVLPIGEGETV